MRYNEVFIATITGVTMEDLGKKKLNKRKRKAPILGA